MLTLDTRFPRLPGDIGNPASFPVPTLTRVVRGAGPRDAVQGAAGQRAAGLFEPFRAAMHQLELEGAAAITTSCGFLVLLQQRLQAAARVPVVSSSLMLLPGLLEEQRQVGVLTISAEHLGEEFLEAAGVPASRLADVAVEGVEPGGAFARTFLGNEPRIDIVAAATDVLAAAQRLKLRAPQLTDLVLECTNMPPYARLIERATGLRTWSLLQSPALLAPFKGSHLPREKR
ncbi:aspartate/glutamate racemase family protein [Ramlibacter solisilvae]